MVREVPYVRPDARDSLVLPFDTSVDCDGGRDGVMLVADMTAWFTH